MILARDLFQKVSTLVSTVHVFPASVLLVSTFHVFPASILSVSTIFPITLRILVQTRPYNETTMNHLRTKT